MFSEVLHMEFRYCFTSNIALVTAWPDGLKEPLYNFQKFLSHGYCVLSINNYVLLYTSV